MEIDLGPELEAFRAEIRHWIDANKPPGLEALADWRSPGMAGSARQVGDATQHPLYAAWDAALSEAHLICPQWPEEFGGRGLSSAQMAVFNEELHRAGLPRVQRGMGEGLVGPSIIVHGTDEQRAHFLPRIISGEDRYCQGFSEPNHGSDLAGVETRGMVDGEEIVITGQKVWTSAAHRATMIFVLCRTDATVSKHRGLSYVLVPMHDNHIEIRPIGQMSGAAEFYEDFFDGARAPLFNVIGGLNNGWRVAMTTLGNERGGRATVQHLAYERELWELVELARKLGRTTEPLVRQQLAWAYTEVELMRYSGLRTLAALVAEREPGPEASITKISWSDYHRRLGELAIELQGMDSLVRPEGAGYPTGRWQDVFLSSRAGTIYSGTNEIQRNIIGERVLGLPKEPRVD